MLTDLEGPVQLSNTPNVISRLALSLNQRVYELLFAVGCADELVRGPGAAACHICGSWFPWPSVSLPLQLGALTWTWFSLARLRWDVSSKCQSTFVNILRWRSEHVPTGCRPTWGRLGRVLGASQETLQQVTQGETDRLFPQNSPTPTAGPSTQLGHKAPSLPAVSRGKRQNRRGMAWRGLS